MDWQSEIQAELEKAQQARARGKEGQARVCARRAAGIAAREYFARRGDPPRTSSAYDLLRLVADDPALPAELRESAHHLTLRVDEQFKLPVNVDLLIAAKDFCKGLLNQ
jgi:HEPN domain-containing protein